MTKEEIEKKLKDVEDERVILRKELNILKNEERKKKINENIIEKALNNEYVYLSKSGGIEGEAILIGQLKIDGAKSVIFQGVYLAYSEIWDENDESDIYFDKIVPEVNINITFRLEDEKFEIIEPWNHVVSQFLKEQKLIQKILNCFNDKK